MLLIKTSIFQKGPFLESIILEEELPASTLELVQIFFASSTFDNIERDKKVQFDVHIILVIRIVIWFLYPFCEVKERMALFR